MQAVVEAHETIDALQLELADAEARGREQLQEQARLRNQLDELERFRERTAALEAELKRAAEERAAAVEREARWRTAHDAEEAAA